VNRALDRAESALDRVLGDGGVLDGIDLPNIEVPHVDIPDIHAPDVDRIVEDALERARQATAGARARAQAAIDNALGRANDLLDRIDLPSITIPDIDLPDLGSIDDLLEDLDVPNLGGDVGDLVDDVLDEIHGVVDNGVLDDLLGDAGGVLDDVLDHTDPVEAALANLPTESLPPVALEAINSAVLTVSAASYSLPMQAASVAVPEPGSLAVLGGLLLGVAGRRR